MAVTERRQKPRVPLGTEAFIEDAGGKEPGHALDLAAQGIGVLCRLDRQVGQRVKVHFFLPNGAGWLATDAVLVRTAKHRGDTLWGIQFQQPDNRTQSLVERYVREQLVVRAREKIHDKAARAAAERERRRQANPLRRLLDVIGSLGRKKDPKRTSR